MTHRDVGTQPDLIFSIVRSPLFALIDLCLALFSGWLIFARPALQGWPVLLALLPWVARLAGGRPIFKPSRFAGWLFLFLLTAGVSAWASYDAMMGWAKFWLLLAAVLVYLALASQPMENYRPVTGIFGGITALVAIYFMLTHDWMAAPADIGLLNRMALAWMVVRPQLNWGWLHPNLVGGLIAVHAPLLIWLFIRSIQKQRWLEAGYAVIAGSIALVGVLFSSSRGSWLALAVALGAWAIFELDAALGQGGNGRLQWTLRGITIAGVLLVCSVALGHAGELAGLLGHLPGPDSSVSRLEIYRNTLRLIAEMPYSGAGLGAFAAQYSEYVLLIPVFLFGYAHNLYLDLAVEQGLPGLVLFMIVAVGSLRLLLAPPAVQVRRPRWLRGALLAALLVMLLHGLLDDPLYGGAGTPLVFVIPGVAVALAGQAPKKQPSPRPQDQGAAAKRALKLRAWAVLIALLLVGLFVFIQRGPLQASWYADRGAVEMARAGLQGFPTDGWDTTTDPEKYALPSRLFERALEHDPLNVTAHYRLGLLAMRQRAFPVAQMHLEQTLELDEGHRGAIKALGYCNTWLGKPQEALRLLGSIPEARREMEAYSGWWLGQARPDLAEKARVMMGLLSGSQ